MKIVAGPAGRGVKYVEYYPASVPDELETGGRRIMIRAEKAR